MMGTAGIKWGIIGLGNIAHKFVTDLLLVPEAELYAVASRNIEKSTDFANHFGAKKAYNSYEALLEDPEVSIVYIATPHHAHYELTLKALRNKKHVLCEKPIAMNCAQTQEMIVVAKENNCFFMEAFWTRFNPSFVEAFAKIKQGDIGEVKYINADFSYLINNPSGRMTEMELGGGSLLDMGVYPLFLTYMILGKPKKILASSLFFDSGADAQTSIILQYDSAQALVYSSFMSHSNMVASVSGTLGRLDINSMWYEAQGYSVVKDVDNKRINFDKPTNGQGFTYEIQECHQCIGNNQIESKLWSHANMLDLTTIVDQIRTQIGLNYATDL